ncbi:unnamed protein product [Sphacelaria rigidula]
MRHRHPGIHVYCTIYLAGKEYPCISAAFSAPGKVWAVPPVTAPLALPPINDPFGCGEVTGAGETSLAASAVAGKGEKDSRGIIQVRADRSLAGSIAIFQRGECPFEQKAKFAEASGAVGLLVVNHEPGGWIWVMPPVLQEENDEKAAVAIPVVMVGREDGEEIRQHALGAAKDMRADSAGALVQVTLDVVTMHQSLYYRLAIKKALAKAFRDKGVPADRSAGSRDADHGPSLGPDSDIKVPGYSDGFVQGMRGAPFAYPRMKGEDGEVEVMGRGHWGIVLKRLNGKDWDLQLVQNHLNPPPKRKKNRKMDAFRRTGEDTEAGGK